MLKLNLPAGLVLVLGLVGGVLEYLNQASFHLVQPWNQVVTYGLFVVAVFGVSPLVHSAFRNALHISTQLGVAITVAATLLAAAITTFSLSHDVKGILVGVVAFLAFIGFGPATGVVPVAPAPAPVPPPA